MFRTHPVLIGATAIILTSLTSACAKDPEPLEEISAAPAIVSGKAIRANPDAAPTQTEDADQPALAIATVASLISVNDVMVRGPERFKRVLCSDGQYYELDYNNGRYSLAAEPLSVCVLFSETKNLKPLGFCADNNCEAAQVSECSEPQKTELLKQFAEDQKVQRCWNIGAFPSLTFTVLMTKVGQSCQAQTLVKSRKGWQQLSSIDGVFEARKTASSEGTGCWWEAGTNFTFEGDWFGGAKRVMPIMAFEKGKGLYALLRSSWSGSENFQLFRLDGEKAIEVESFAESFKEPDLRSLAPELAAPPETQAKAATSKSGKPKVEAQAKVKGKAKTPDKASKGQASAAEQAMGSPSGEDGAVSPIDERSIPEASEATPDIEPGAEPAPTSEGKYPEEGNPFSAPVDTTPPTD